MALFMMSYPDEVMDQVTGNIWGDKEAIPWALTAVGGRYHLVQHPITTLGRMSHKKNKYTQFVMGQSCPQDGLLLFAHANLGEWRCTETVGRLRDEMRRMQYVWKNPEIYSHLALNFKEYLNSIYFESWWQMDEDPEAELWRVIASVCKSIQVSN